MKIAASLLILGLLSAPAQALTLDGSVEKTDVEGRIGVRISTTGFISKVHPGSPAEQAGLRKHDTVLAVDGKKHAIEEISGEPGSCVLLNVKRGWRKFEIAVERTDVRQIYY